MMYVPHNIQFLWASYMMEGNSRGAFKASRELDDAVPLAMVRQMPMAEFMSPTRYFTEARFANWDAILKEPAPPRGSDLHDRQSGTTRAASRWRRRIVPDDALAEKKKIDAIVAATPPERDRGIQFGRSIARDGLGDARRRDRFRQGAA